MKTVVWLCLLAALIAVAPSVHAYTYLQVSNPQTLKSGIGTVEEMSVSMTPNGAFMKYDVTMTFSARVTSSFAQTESLEVTYQFALPADAVVNDLYLWVGNEISRGLILDRATASATYEGIVKRRRDPAFLQKTSQTQYQLQIYPMAAGGSRKVRFTYLAPLGRSADQWYASVPRDLFLTTYSMPLTTLRLIYNAPSPSHVPKFLNPPNFAFIPWTDSLAQGNAWKCDVIKETFAGIEILIAVPIALRENYLFTRYTGPAGGAYHVLLDPFSMLGITASRRFIVAFDYDTLKTTLTRTSYVDAVRTMLLTTCSVKDSFNIVFNSWQRSGEKWFAADSAGINSAFGTLGAQTIPTVSDIPGLFMNVVDFMNLRGVPAGIILVAASDKLSTPSAADPVLTWLNTKLPKGIPIHVVNVMNRNYTYTYINTPPYSVFSSNTYFYDMLKSKFGGSVRAATSESAFASALNAVTQTMRGGLSSFDVQVRLENGFTYAKYTYGTTLFQPLYAAQSAGQIGKYAGSGPMTLEVAGFYAGQPYQKKIPIADSIILPADSSLRAVWAAKSIGDLEWGYNQPDVVKSITDACIAERVVCRYTALLALEPGDTLVIAKNDTPIRVTQAGSAGQAPGSYQIAAAYPNPFNPSTTLRVRLPQGVKAQDAALRIYNMLGQVVKTFDAAGLSSDADREFKWDGMDDLGRRVSSGMYLFVVATPAARHTVKLMLLK